MRRLLYKSFRLTYAVEAWFVRRFTPAGRLVAASLAATAVVGIDTNRTLAYQAFAFLVALLAVALGSSLFFRGRFAVERRLPRYGTAGEPLPYRLSVENLTDRLHTGLVVVEALADPRPTIEELRDSREPGEDRRNWFDRTVGYPRWSWLIAQNCQADAREVAVPPLSPRSRIDVSPEIVPARRGHLRLTGTTIARPDPFGLFKACVTLPAPGSVLVLPKRYPLPRLALPGRRRYQRGGVSLATSVGDSEEFAALRDYRPGDALRRVHWRSWARLGKPIVKEYQDEFFVRHALILDTFVGTSGSGAGDDGAAGRRAVAFEEAVSVAASFACAIETQESLLDLLFVGPEAYAFTAGRGVAHTERMLEILACVRACTTRPFGALHRLVLDRQSGLAGAVCVLLGWDAERRGLVADLEAHGIPVLAVVVSGEAPPGDAAGPAPSGGLHFAAPGRVAEGLARL